MSDSDSRIRVHRGLHRPSRWREHLYLRYRSRESRKDAADSVAKACEEPTIRIWNCAYGVFWTASRHPVQRGDTLQAGINDGQIDGRFKSATSRTASRLFKVQGSRPVPLGIQPEQEVRQASKQNPVLRGQSELLAELRARALLNLRKGFSSGEDFQDESRHPLPPSGRFFKRDQTFGLAHSRI
jgi:hypothetical protein